LWDLKTGAERLREVNAMDVVPGALAFSPDAREALAGTSWGVRAWQLPLLAPGPEGKPSDSPGQVLIESEVSGNLGVSLRRDGKHTHMVYPSFYLQPLSLPPGEYEHQPARGAEGVKVTPARFTLKGGHQVVLRVRAATPLTLTRPAREDEPARRALALLRKRLDDPDEDRQKLRAALLAFVSRHAGLPSALEAAGLLGRLSSPADGLKRAAIPARELAAAGGGDPKKAPPELVAVLGDSRFPRASGTTRLAQSPDGKLLAGWGGWMPGFDCGSCPPAGCATSWAPRRGGRPGGGSGSRPWPSAPTAGWPSPGRTGRSACGTGSAASTCAT
jgi:hypothetical protein